MITVEQQQTLQAIASGIEATADQIELIAGGGVQLKLILNDEFPEQSPAIVGLLSTVDRVNKAAIDVTHLMRAVSAQAQQAADGGADFE